MLGSGQISLVASAGSLLAAGWGFSLARLWWDKAWIKSAARVCLWVGTAVLLASALITAGYSERWWVPLEDNFAAFVWLGLLLAGFLAYVQARRPVPGLDWFLLPMVVMSLAAAIVFGGAKPHDYVPATWYTLHRVTSYSGTAGFAVAAAAGAMYLIVSRRLRRKQLAGHAQLGSLERLEHLAFTSVTLGFALLTIGIITGVFYFARGGVHRIADADLFPKVTLATAVWLVYAVVLHAPINPAIRGRRSAMLSILGFLLMVGTVVVVQFMPLQVEEPAQTSEPINTDQPVNTDAPANTDAPVNTATPSNTGTPANTGTPVNTVMPANTDAETTRPTQPATGGEEASG